MNFYKQIENMMDDMVLNTQKLIAYKSVQAEPLENMPYGKNMDDALNFVLSLADEMGFKTEKIEGYCGYAEYGEGDTYIGVFAHIDVNEENESEWRNDPYKGIIKNNRIYGCCAVDKGALIAALYALKAVKDASCKLKRKVRLIIGTDERRYYSDMNKYLQHETAPIAGFCVDGHFPITYSEKALAMFEFKKEISQNTDEYIEFIHGGKIDNLVAGYCSAKLVTNRKKKILTILEEYTEEYRRDINAKSLSDGLLIEVFGKERHCASIEKGINSNAIMIDFLDYIDFGGDEIKNIISFINKNIGMDIYGEALNISYEDEVSGKTTVNFGILSFENNCFNIRIDCRFPTTSNYYQAIETVNSCFTNKDFEILECTYWPPTYFPKNHFLINALLETYRDVAGDDSEPVSGNSASYSKVMPNIAAFGAHYPGDGISWDQTDEYIDIELLEKTAKIYANAIHKLCTEV